MSAVEPSQVETESPKLALGEWIDQAIAFSESLRAEYGDEHTFGVLQALDEIRDEQIERHT